MSAQWALQQAVFAALDGVISVPVFDEPPQEQAAPYVVIGDDTVADHSSDGELGFEVTMTIHTWSTYAGTKEAKLIQGEVYDALQRAELTIVGYTVLGVDFEYCEVFRDPDGTTYHGVQRFRTILTTD